MLGAIMMLVRAKKILKLLTSSLPTSEADILRSGGMFLVAGATKGALVEVICDFFDFEVEHMLTQLSHQQLLYHFNILLVSDKSSPI
jgi:hypothetical protein